MHQVLQHESNAWVLLHHDGAHEFHQANQYQGNYFMPNASEGAFIPMEESILKYPHPTMKLEEFLPQRH